MNIQKLFFQILIISIFLISFGKNANAQNENYPNAFSFNLVEMDYNTLRKGEGFDIDHLSLGLKLGYHRHLYNELFHLEIPLNLGFAKIQNDSVISDPTLLDNKFKASLGGLFQVNFLPRSEKFRPYFSTGFVGTYLGKDVDPWHMEIPVGIGFDFKVTKRTSLQIRPEYRFGVFSKNTNNFNLNFGAIFLIGVQDDGAPVIKSRKRDRDGDGVKDDVDRCPDTPGLIFMAGCPDSDLDEIADPDDECPFEFGLISNNGCPKVEKEVQEAVSFAAKSIQFETNSARIKTASFAELDNIVKILKENEAVKVTISGHTDSVGGEQANQKLSEKRANACLDYLVDNGISRSRLTAIGFGETKPIADNGTEAGKKANRRVVFQLY